MERMIVTTTPRVEGKPVSRYLGIVSGEAILGANIVKDVFAGIRDIVFPAGTYWLRRFARAICAPCPAPS